MHAGRHNEERPRGAWFEPSNTARRRFASKAIQFAGGCLGAMAGGATLLAILDPATGPKDRTVLVLLTIGALAGGALVYFIVDMVGAGLTAVSWGALFHDLRLRSVWVLLLEIALFLSVLPMEWYSIREFVNHGSVYGGLVAMQLFCLTFWPFMRHRIRHGRWPDQR